MFTPALLTDGECYPASGHKRPVWRRAGPIFGQGLGGGQMAG